MMSMLPRTKVIRILAEFARLNEDKPTIKEAVDEATYMHDLVFNALEHSDNKDDGLKLLSEHIADMAGLDMNEESDEMASFMYTLVTNAIAIVIPQAKATRTLVGKFPTDFSKPIVDASNGNQVDLMGGPEGIKR
jgi:hypothetical protein